MKAVAIGVTGATGKDLLNLLLRDSAFDRVDVFVRRALDVTHDKLYVHVVNFDRPDEWKSLVTGDALFSALGTTLKAAGSKDAQRIIDYDYQYNFAAAGKANNITACVLVSADGANAKSPLFYSKIKGELEEAITALGYPSFTIFNPPILERKNTDRQGELTGIKVINFLNRFGILRSQKPLPTEVLAQAMINAAKRRAPGVAHFKAAAIWTLAQQRPDA